MHAQFTTGAGGVKPAKTLNSKYPSTFCASRNSGGRRSVWELEPRPVALGVRNWQRECGRQPDIVPGNSRPRRGRSWVDKPRLVEAGGTQVKPIRRKVHDGLQPKATFIFSKGERPPILRVCQRRRGIPAENATTSSDQRETMHAETSTSVAHRFNDCIHAEIPFVPIACLSLWQTEKI